MRNKYKLKSGLAALALMALVAANLAYAETGTNRKVSATTINEAKLKARALKAQAIKKLAVAQGNRAQGAIDRLSAIIDRIKVLRGKSAGTAAELAAIDVLITKAQEQKTDAEKALADLKTKATTLEDALTAAAADPTATAPVRPVKEFMAEVRLLKTDLIALHKTLKDIVKQMKALNKPAETDSDSDQDTNTNSTSNPNAGDEENE